jgi:magnesium-protoporphyrin O-methyltransferase
MTCKHCCGADQFFDLKGAQKEMKRFKRKGAGKATKQLLKFLFLQDVKGKTLLDVGGGIGAIQWSFLKNGGTKTMDVDASNGYIKVAETHAIENNLMGKTQFLIGNFADKSEEIHNYDFVTLDKVICCYPDYKSLLGMALEKCNETIALTFPLGGPISKIIAIFGNMYFYFKKNPFHSYVHSPRDIEKFIHSRGFKTIHKRISFPWHIQVYDKV